MNELCTKAELADFLKVSTATVERWTYDKTIPFFKCKNTVRFDRMKILSLMSRNDNEFSNTRVA